MKTYLTLKDIYHNLSKLVQTSGKVQNADAKKPDWVVRPGELGWAGQGKKAKSRREEKEVRGGRYVALRCHAASPKPASRDNRLCQSLRSWGRAVLRCAARRRWLNAR